MILVIPRSEGISGESGNHDDSFKFRDSGNSKESIDSDDSAQSYGSGASGDIIISYESYCSAESGESCDSSGNRNSDGNYDSSMYMAILILVKLVLLVILKIFEQLLIHKSWNMRAKAQFHKEEVVFNWYSNI